MQRKKATRSMRWVVLVVSGAILVLFIAAFFTIVRTSMTAMLLRSENVYIENQMAVVQGVLKDRENELLITALDIANWEETIQFIKGNRPNYVSENWPGMGILFSSRADLVIIKDRNGKDCYVEYVDQMHSKALSLPEGLSEYLSVVAREAVNKYTPVTVEDVYNGAPYGKAGILLYQGTAFDVRVLPVALLGTEDEPVGTVIFANLMDDEHLRYITHYDDTAFEVLDRLSVSQSTPSIDVKTGDTVSAMLPLTDMFGNPAQLRMTMGRTLYTEGQRIIMLAVLLMIAAVCLLVTVLYLLISRYAIRPVERLSKALARASAADGIDTTGLTSTREMLMLCTSVGDMLHRLKLTMRQAEASSVSLNVLTTILNGIDAFLYVTDANTDRILFINDRMREHYGLSPDVIGEKCWKVLQQGIDDRCDFCPMRRLQDHPDEIIVWEEHSTVTGRFYRNTDCLIQWTGGGTAHLQHSVDITELKEAQSNLKRRLEQQELMSAISQNFISTADIPQLIMRALSMAGEFMALTNVVLAKFDPTARLVMPVEEWCQSGARSWPKEIAVPLREGWIWHDAFVAQSRPYLTQDEPMTEEERAVYGQMSICSYLDVPVYVGGQFWGVLSFVEANATRVWTDSDAQLARLISNVIAGVILRDITEADLLRMSSIVNTSRNFIVYIPSWDKFAYANQGAAEITGYTVDELLAGGLNLLLSPDDLRRVRDDYLPAFPDARHLQVEIPIRRKDGEERILSVSVFSLNTATQNFGVIASDITEKRRLEQELVKAKEQAESASRAKSDFLSSMSHEMRTPMNAIIGMTNIAKSSNDPEKKEYCLDKIEGASQHLLGIINDILDMSKIEANKFELSLSAFSFDQMLRRVVSVINFRVEEKSQTFKVQLEPDLPEFIRADEQRLAQVVTNLLSNAIKFTPDGGEINLTASVAQRRGGTLTLQVSVGDTGIGISREQQAKLFRSFAQADNGISRRFGGTGLGLAISKRIVEMMDGHIRVESEPNRGSVFTFDVTVEEVDSLGQVQPAVEAADAPRPTQGRYTGKRVLLVEDVEINREIVITLLEDTGVAIDCAENGLAAVTMFADAPDAYDMIFMDIHMPEMDGYEATRRIRAMDVDRAKTVPIVAMTANVFREDVERCLAAGMNGHLGKPIDMGDLFARLETYLG